MKPENGGSQIDRPEECLGPFVISGGNPSALRERGEEVCHEVSGFLPFLVVCPRHFSVCPWRDDGLHPGAVQQGQHPVLRLVGFVRQQCLCAGEQSGQ
jgi:hypothetical protein